jgi:hypothetical protein
VTLPLELRGDVSEADRQRRTASSQPDSTVPARPGSAPRGRLRFAAARLCRRRGSAAAAGPPRRSALRARGLENGSLDICSSRGAVRSGLTANRGHVLHIRRICQAGAGFRRPLRLGPAAPDRRRRLVKRSPREHKSRRMVEVASERHGREQVTALGPSRRDWRSPGRHLTVNAVKMEPSAARRRQCSERRSRETPPRVGI